MNINQDNQLTGAVIGAAIDVHRQLGPLLDEAAYEEALARRLTAQAVACRRQVPLPLRYKGVRLDCGYRIDLLVKGRLPVELKTVESLLPVHDAQLLTYQRIGRFPLGLLVNFNVAVLKDGVKRLAETRAWVPQPGNPAELDAALAFDTISAAVVLAAVEVHRQVGPGLLSSSYVACICHELSARKVPFQQAVAMPLQFDGMLLSTQVEIPLVVARELPVFPVCAEALTKVHTAAALARLHQGSWKQGLILNFNARTMLDGIKRVVVQNE